MAGGGSEGAGQKKGLKRRDLGKNPNNDGTAQGVMTILARMGFSTIDFVFLAGMIGVMWMLIILPKQREQKALAKMFAALKKGDRVLTHSGMYGEIAAIKDQVVTLRFHDNIRIDFDRSAIAKSLETPAGKDAAPVAQEAKA
jgi:preprotein translocase subunit YajC